MHKKSEKTIRNWVKSSGLKLPLKYREKSQQKIAFTSNYGHHSLVTANNATQRLTKQLVLNLKSNWPSLSKNTIDSQPKSSNSTNCETISIETDLKKKRKIDENKLGSKKIIPASSLNTTAHVLDLEELTIDPPSQKSLTENQSLVTDMLTCSKDDCGFKTKYKRCLNLHIKGKVQLFSEVHKNVRNHPYGFEIYLLNVKTRRTIAHILWSSQKS